METFDLYTYDGKKTERIMIRGTCIPEGYIRYIIHVIIFNSHGEMLIQQRQPFKKGWSGMWDVSAGGSVISGETVQEGAEREVREELGLEISLKDAVPAMVLRFDEGLNFIYLVQMDVDPQDLHLQEEEVCQAVWAEKEEILHMIDDGRFVTYHKGFIELLFHFRSNNDIFIAEDPTE